MKKVLISLSMFTLVFLLTSGINKIQKSAGPPSCNAGEPPNNTNCTSCHNDAALNSGNAAVQLDLGGADTNYVAGKKYTITVSIAKGGMMRAGFQCIALQDNNDKISPGSISLTDATRTQLLDKNAPHAGGCKNEERVWVEHTFAGCSSISGKNIWVYDWTAPQAGVGQITFYLAAVEANNDLNETGDFVYTLKKTITGLPIGIKEVDIESGYSIFPSPAISFIEISNIIIKPEVISLNDLKGNQVKIYEQNELIVHNGILTLPLSNIPEGVYLLSIQTSEGKVVRKILKRSN